MKILRLLGKGIGHEDSGQGCQDKIGVLFTENGKRIFTISDGCSSSAYAEEAAQCNVRVINNVFSHFDFNNLSRSSFISLYPKISEDLLKYEENDIVSCFSHAFKYEIYRRTIELNLSNAQFSDFFATLLFVVVENENTTIGHIGDGNVIFYDKDGKVVYRSQEDNGEDSRQTFFTASPDFDKRFHLNIIPTDSYDSFALFSDGLQTLFKLESGTIDKGAYEIVVGPIKKNQIVTENDLIKTLQKHLSNAMHYGFDDWSLIVAIKQMDVLPDITPVSLKQLFMETYNKRMTSAENTTDSIKKDKDQEISIEDSDNNPKDNNKIEKLTSKKIYENYETSDKRKTSDVVSSDTEKVNDKRSGDRDNDLLEDNSESTSVISIVAGLLLRRKK